MAFGISYVWFYGWPDDDSFESKHVAVSVICEYIGVFVIYIYIIKG